MATSPNYGWLEPDNTDLVKNGALAIRTLGNAIDTTMATMTPKSIVDAKGDLIAASAADTPARLAVGNNGETLVADSSTSTGLRYQGNYSAGKNAIINGDFRIWQRGTSFTSPANAYTADRWHIDVNTGSLGTGTVSQQTFTPGTAPVAGYEGQYFWRYNLTATGTSSFHYLGTKLEDVRLFAGQTATLSFWGKADSARTITSEMLQIFGSGGSGAVVTAGTTHSFTTAWQRFTVTISVPSISGKTIGTGSYLYPRIYWTAAAGATIDTWGWQLEAGSVATAFQTATGTIQGELAACQRYYWRSGDAVSYQTFGTGIGKSATVTGVSVALPVSMRVVPTSLDYSNLAVFDGTTVVTVTSAVITAGQVDYNHGYLETTSASGVTQYRPYFLLRNGSTSGYVGFSAEL